MGSALVCSKQKTLSAQAGLAQDSDGHQKQGGGCQGAQTTLFAELPLPLQFLPKFAHFYLESHRGAETF